jgi:hypothetical protein
MNLAKLSAEQVSVHDAVVERVEPRSRAHWKNGQQASGRPLLNQGRFATPPRLRAKFGR